VGSREWLHELLCAFYDYFYALSNYIARKNIEDFVDLIGNVLRWVHIVLIKWQRLSLDGIWFFGPDQQEILVKWQKECIRQTCKNAGRQTNEISYTERQTDRHRQMHEKGYVI
jgi:hypothetical protein